MKDIKKTNKEDVKEDNKENETDNLAFKGYILFDYLNFNKIVADSFNSEHAIINSKVKLKYNKSKLYSLTDNENIFYILDLKKWFYSSSKVLEDYKIKLFDELDTIPIDDYVFQDELQKIDSEHYQNVKIKHDDLKKKNMNAMMKTFNFEQYILYEFVENNQIKIIKKSESKEELIENKTIFQQISKLFNKKSDEKVKFIRAIRKWYYDSESSLNENILLEDNYDNLDIPDNKEEIETKKIDLKIKKNNNLIFKGWLFFKNIQDNQIIAREYISSNELFKRKEIEEGISSEIFLCKNNRMYKYIKEIDKYYEINENLKNQDLNITIYEKID